MENKLITAIDIGTTKIVALRGRAVDHNKIEVVAFGMNTSVGVERGIVHNVELTAESIKKALDQVKGVHNEPLGDVWVGIAGQHVHSVKTGAVMHFDDANHVISIEDIEQMIQEGFKTTTKPGEAVVNVIPQNFELDHTTTIEWPIGAQTNQIKASFHLTIAKEEAYANINKSLELNRLSVNELVLESIASAKSVLGASEIERGVALVDIGGGTSDLAVMHNSMVVHSAVIPFGGQSITYDIMNAFNVDHAHAEALKRDYCQMLLNSQSNETIALKDVNGQKIRIKQKDLSLVIRSRMEEIIDFIKFQIELCGFTSKLPGGMVITGGGSQLRDLTQLFAFHFNQMPVRIGRPNKQFISGIFEDDLNNPSFSTASGLLLFGIEQHFYLEKEEALIKAKYEEQKTQAEKEKQNQMEMERIEQERLLAMEKIKTVTVKAQSGPAKDSTFKAIRNRLKNIFNEGDQELN